MLWKRQRLMQPEKVFKRYDIRGAYPKELDREFVERMGKALGSFVLEKYGDEVVVCRDNKDSSEPLKEKLIEGLNSTGVDVLDVGIGPTDFAAFHGNREDAVSVQVTSSHMPLEFNGLKFMYPEGNGFLNDDLDRLKELFKQQDFSRGSGSRKEIENARKKYIDELVEDVERYGERFDRRIAVDTLGGATRELLPEALKQLDFEVVDIGKNRDGIYRNPPNPDPDRLKELEKAVESENCFLGAAMDLDGDRVKIYFNGEWISGDDLFCVFAQIFDGEIIASVDTSEKLERFSYVTYTRVGDPFVIDETLKMSAVLSGEPNGHYCFPEFVNYNSGILAAALASSADLDELLANVPEREVRKENIEFGSRKETVEAMKEFEDYASEKLNVSSTVDGVKFSYEGASVLVRPSGSSPKIRVKSEGVSAQEAERGLSKVLEVLGKE
jgi:phosphomannomutase